MGLLWCHMKCLVQCLAHSKCSIHCCYYYYNTNKHCITTLWSFIRVFFKVLMYFYPLNYPQNKIYMIAFRIKHFNILLCWWVIPETVIPLYLNYSMTYNDYLCFNYKMVITAWNVLIQWLKLLAFFDMAMFLLSGKQCIYFISL